MLTVNQELQGGRYRILNQFGSEDLGASYQAFDNVLQTKVIIKETFADNPGLYKNTITRQMESLSSIKHESFTQVHGYFSEVDRQYLVTESAEGKSLKDLLEKNQKPFLLSDVLFWVEQALNALNYLHSKIPPIIHCGITPNNLILVENKKIKLLTSAIIKDFGSKSSEKQKDQFSELKLPYLSLELLWETLDPASQKVILNSYSVESAEILESSVDERSSVYALGATVYHLITGKVPVNALERSIEILDGKDDPLVDPSNLNSQIPRNFSAFLLKSLELKRENRFASISEMRVSLQPMLDLIRKIEDEKQREANNQAVREAALREVELARQALKKQREEEALKKAQAEQAALQAKMQPKPQIVESVPVVPTPAQNEVVLEKESVEVKPVTTSQVVATAQTFTEELPQTFSAAEDDLEVFSTALTERKKPFWLIPVFCTVLVLLVGGFFGMKFLNSSDADANVQKPAEQNNPVKREENPPAADTQLTSPTVSQEQPNAETQQTAESAAKNNKKSTVPTSVEKKATTAKTPAPKKKEVSVDDIINDN
ncbi:MAG: protein kinase [Pyrinomonadaceae bacterium]|nr:protein kinase [Pyrinomonadaceae bacterium]